MTPADRLAPRVLEFEQFLREALPLPRFREAQSHLVAISLEAMRVVSPTDPDLRAALIRLADSWVAMATELDRQIEHLNRRTASERIIQRLGRMLALSDCAEELRAALQDSPKRELTAREQAFALTGRAEFAPKGAASPPEGS